MRVDVHTELTPDLARAWDAVFAQDPEATPFASSGWAEAWLREWEHDPGRPIILTVEDAGQIVGVASFAMRNRGPFRVLNTLGQPPGDYWDIVAVDSEREGVLAAVVGWLLSSRRRWDVVSLTALRQGSATERALEAAPLRIARRDPVPCPGIELPSTFDEYLKELPSKRRTNIRRHLRTLDDERVVELREVTSPERLPATLERWQEIRTRQWSERGPEEFNEMHGEPSFRAFMLAVTRRLVPLGLAVVWELVRDDDVVGAWVNFADRRAMYWYLGGFEPDLHALGLGKIAIVAAIRSSIEQGRSYFDFGVGDEDYKYWYGATDRLMPRLVVGHGGVRSRLGHRASARVGGR